MTYEIARKLSDELLKYSQELVSQKRIFFKYTSRPCMQLMNIAHVFFLMLKEYNMVQDVKFKDFNISLPLVIGDTWQTEEFKYATGITINKMKKCQLAVTLDYEIAKQFPIELYNNCFVQLLYGEDYNVTLYELSCIDYIYKFQDKGVVHFRVKILRDINKFNSDYDFEEELQEIEEQLNEEGNNRGKSNA